MPRLRKTGELRTVLAAWADDRRDRLRADRAQEAYLSTDAMSGEDGRPIFFITVDDDLLAELRRRVRVEELPDR
jgi:hypothetical protein